MSVRPVARIMALNKEVYAAIPHVRHRGPKRPPQPHPSKASRPHQSWFIDGRMLDGALEGGTWGESREAGRVLTDHPGWGDSAF
jgi:hypothetical protein